MLFGNKFLELNSNAKVIYITSEEMYELVTQNIKNGDHNGFRKSFISADLLLIDNMQFFTGKKAFQEEIIHLFNFLYEERKLMVFASDKSPREIPEFSARLRTRLEWGVLADISVPDYDTKLKFLNKKIAEINPDISEEIIKCIASIKDLNFMSIEGVLNKLKGITEIGNVPITSEMIYNILEKYKEGL